MVRQRRGHNRVRSSSGEPIGFCEPAKALDPSLYKSDLVRRHCQEVERQKVGEQHYASLKSLRKLLWLKKQHEKFKLRTRGQV